MFITLQTKILPDETQEEKLYSFFDRMNQVKREISEAIFKEENIEFKTIYKSFVEKYPDVQSRRIELLMKLVCGHLKGFRTFLRKLEMEVNWMRGLTNLSDKQKKKLEEKEERLKRLKNKTFLNYKKLSSVPNDKGCMGIKFEGDVSLNLINGKKREKITHLPPNHRVDLFAEQKANLQEMRRLQKEQKNQKGSAIKENLLVHRNGKFFLYIPAEVKWEPPKLVEEFIGVDLGIENLATTNDGLRFSGKDVEKYRVKCKKFRKSLQEAAKKKEEKKIRPKNIRRRLKKFGKKESRYKRDINHCIAKKLVLLALETHRGIALENLKNIRKNKSFDGKKGEKPKDNANKMNSWGFAQLRDFITYKAQIYGVRLVIVNPKDTSKICSVCKHTEKENRVSQSEFVCKKCGNKDNADVNAAKNISAFGLESYSQKSRIILLGEVSES